MGDKELEFTFEGKPYFLDEDSTGAFCVVDAAQCICDDKEKQGWDLKGSTSFLLGCDLEEMAGCNPLVICVPNNGSILLETIIVCRAYATQCNVEYVSAQAYERQGFPKECVGFTKAVYRTEREMVFEVQPRFFRKKGVK